MTEDEIVDQLVEMCLHYRRLLGYPTITRELLLRDADQSRATGRTCPRVSWLAEYVSEFAELSATQQTAH